VMTQGRGAICWVALHGKTAPRSKKALRETSSSTH